MKVTKLLFLVLLIFIVSSCSDDSSGVNEQTDRISETESDEISDDNVISRPQYPQKNYDNYEFIIIHSLRANGPVNYIAVDESNGEILNDTVFNRNMKIEDLFNVKIVSVDTGVNEAQARASIMAGDDEYDCYIGGMTLMGKLAMDNLLMDIKKIDEIDLSKSWWDIQINDGLTIGNQLFYASGSMITQNNDSAYIVRFNIDLGDTFGVDKFQLYQYVRDGEWTIDKMSEIAKQFSSDLDGNGLYTWEDRYGLACANSFFQALFYGMNCNITLKDSDDYLIYNPYSDYIGSVCDKISVLMSDTENTLNGNRIQQPGFNHAETADNAIADGRAFFHATILEAMVRSRDVEAAIGIIPLPKFSESQESYVSMLNPNGVVVFLGLPTTAKDMERTGIIIEALMAESYFDLTPAYYDTVMQHKLLRDDESFEMLDYILANRTAPDMGYVYGYGSLLNKIQESVINNAGTVVSVYAAAESQVLAAIEEHNNLFSSIN